MAKHTKNLTTKITTFLGSGRCFAAIVALFILEALWIALSGRYPMAFDENFHLGIIRLYAHHISPFWTGQPLGADQFGAVARDPSYLYQWLMSFPYRLVAVFTNNQTAQVLILRFINIGLLATSLPVYRRLLLKTGASRTLVHLCLALFILIPITPLLAAQINYDNLLLPLTALTLLLAVNFNEELRKYKRVNVKTLLWLLIVGLITCLVKYAFLPILLVVIVYSLIILHHTYYPDYRKLWLSLGFGWTLVARRTRWLLLIIFVLISGLFLQRYGVNLVHYHKAIPDCSQVLSAQRCSAYSPWVRDHILETEKPVNSTSSPLVFTADWFYGMWLRSFFAVDGPATNFQTRGPLIMPAIGAIIFAVAALLATLATVPKLLRTYNKQVLWLFVAVMAVYAGALWFDGYQSFLQTGQAVAINGRYLLPVIPLLLVLLALGVNELFRDHQGVKLVIGGLVLVCILWGGGALTYILRSNDAWYWRNQAVYDVNHAVQQVLGPVTPGYYSPNEFMGHN
jgi:hypothetical protein